MTFWQQAYLEKKWLDQYLPIALCYTHEDGWTVGMVDVNFGWEED